MLLRGSVEYIALLCQRRNIRIDVSLFFPHPSAVYHTRHVFITKCNEVAYHRHDGAIDDFRSVGHGFSGRPVV